MWIPSSGEVCPYALRYYASHLADAGQWQALHALVATGDERGHFAEARLAADGSYGEPPRVQPSPGNQRASVALGRTREAGSAGLSVQGMQPV